MSDHIFPAGNNPAGLYLPLTVGPAIVESIEVLQAVLDCIPPGGRFCEFGTWTGSLAAWIADRRPRGLVVCVDDFVFAPNNLSLWSINRRTNMRLFVGSVAEFGRLNGETYHAVLVDANHKLPGVAEDLIVAERLVSDGGAMLVHDYGCDGWPDVATAVDAFIDGGRWVIARQTASLVELRRAN